MYDSTLTSIWLLVTFSAYWPSPASQGSHAPSLACWRSTCPAVFYLRQHAISVYELGWPKMSKPFFSSTKSLPVGLWATSGSSILLVLLKSKQICHFRQPNFWTELWTKFRQTSFTACEELPGVLNSHKRLAVYWINELFFELQGVRLERSESYCLLFLKYECLWLFEPSERSTDVVHLIIYTL